MPDRPDAVAARCDYWTAAGIRQELLTFAKAFRYAVEAEFIDGDEPPLWLRNGYDNAREITGLDRECWPAPWERSDRG